MDTCVHGGDGCVGLTLPQLALPSCPDKEAPPDALEADQDHFLLSMLEGSVWVGGGGRKVCDEWARVTDVRGGARCLRLDGIMSCRCGHSLQLSFQAVQMHLLQDRAVQGSIVLYRMLICV